MCFALFNLVEELLGVLMQTAFVGDPPKGELVEAVRTAIRVDGRHGMECLDGFRQLAGFNQGQYIGMSTRSFRPQLGLPSARLAFP